MSGYFPLTTNYSGQHLALFNELQPDNQWWGENPILLSQDERKSINLDHVCKILAKKNLSPRKLSELSVEELQDPIINTIETLYKMAIVNYQNMTKLAIEKDLTTSKPLNEAFRKKIQEQPNHTAQSAAIGLAFAVIGAIPGYFIGASKDKEQHERNCKEKLNIQITSSLERRDLLKTIYKLEQVRYENIKISLQEAGYRVYTLFQERRIHEIYDDSLLRKFKIYEKMFRTFFPDSTFLIDKSLQENKIEDLVPQSQDLQSWIQIKFSANACLEAKACEQLIFEIVAMSKNCSEQSMNLFFTEIVKVTNYLTIKKYLTILKQICEKGLTESFFQCVTSKKICYYPASTLFLIINSFYELAQSSTRLNVQTPFPYYDAGGKEYLLQLRKPPSDPSRLHLSPLEGLHVDLDSAEEHINESKFFDIHEEKEILHLIEKFSGKDRNVSIPIPQKHLEIIKNQYLTVIEFCQKWRSYPIDRLVEAAKEISKSSGSNEEKIVQLIAIGRLAILKEFKKYLYPEQVLTVLGLLSYPKSCVAQVKTGEGKSLIHTLLSFVLTMQGKTVHIISSSANLSERDQKAASNLFKRFHIRTSHICEQFPKAEKFQSQILYGKVHDFEFAVMREMLENSVLFPQKKSLKQEKRFDCVLIDELDNLTIDTALNHARLSYPAEATYEWIYLPIFTFVKNHISKEDKEKLTSPKTLENLKQFLKARLDETFLKKAAALSDEQLQIWLQSAYKALYLLEEKKHYVVSLSKEKEDIKSVLIVDADNTGRILHGCRWSNGLHEFVEIKHELKPEKESLTPLSLSHATFYQFYHSIYGLTGTLGSQYDRDEIKEIYGIESFDVPTHLPCLREDKPLRIVDSKLLYWQTIIQEILTYRQQQRPILVLCAAIQESEYLSNLLKEHHIPFDLLNEMQPDPEEEILKRAGLAGAVTVATNTAGRGADIILTEQSRVNGGLHVLITFFPESWRVEYQARGRAGRQGEKGSSEILISKEHFREIYGAENLSLQDMERYLNEFREISARRMKNEHIVQATLDQNRFDYVLYFFTAIKRFQELLNNQIFLNNTAAALSNLKSLHAREKKQNLLDPKDLQLRDAFYGFLENGGSQVGYKLFLQKLGKKIVGRCLNTWSIHFSQQVDDLLRESETFSNAYQHEQFSQILLSFLTSNAMRSNTQVDEIYKSLKIELEKFQHIQLMTLQKKIDNCYEESKSHWECYLDPSGKGLMRYLQDISGVNLRGIC